MENGQVLVKHLEKIELFEERYTDLKCININDDGKKRAGNFSLVFKALDTIEDKFVVFKFYDPDKNTETYRLESFKRESDLLKNIIGKNRCLQLKQEHSLYTLEIETTIGKMNLEYPYFITEWLPKGLEDLFEEINDSDIIVKLKVFNNILLAVEALHRYNLYHRDLKPNNFMLREIIDNLIIAIDLGTAARLDSKALISEYNSQVGHLYYSSPEALCGFSSNRELAKYTDFYALGCMLYELFSYEYFYSKINASHILDTISFVIGQKLVIANDKDKLSIWNDEILNFKKGIIYPSFDDEGINIPSVIKELLDRVLLKLTSIDYRDRAEDLVMVRHWINTTIKILNNEKYQKMLTRRKKIFRKNKTKKIKSKLLLVGAKK